MTSALPAAAQDATWSSAPGSGDYNTAANWTPTAVPTGTAFFGTTTGSAVTFSTGTTVGGWTFNPGASAYSFTNSGQSLSFTGAGIDIQGGSAAITNSDIGSLTFNNSSTAGSAAITNTTGASFSGGRLIFNNTSTAGSATITNRNGPVFFNDASTAGSATILTTDGGFNRVYFKNTSTAGSASITANNFAEVHFDATSTAGSATITTTNGGSVIFDNTSTAGNAAITNNSGNNVLFNATSTAGNASITNNGDLYFFNSSTAGSATITTNSGGRSQIAHSSSGGTARFILNGTGALDVSMRTTGTTAGSIEGAGSVFLGSNNLAVGGNNRSTTFAGVIQDGGFAGGTGGSLTKTGSGTLTLSGANTYTGGTTINAGTLAISADNNLGASTGGLTFTGGTLQFGAGFDLGNSRTIALNAGGGTFDTNGFNTTVSQTIGGSGALVKAGSGMLTLSGANTYSGGTTISAGALQIGDGFITGSVLGNITNNAALIFNRLDAVIFDGVISGSGTLERLGPFGSLTLSGINTYTGATTVSGGVLQISGSIASNSVTNNATLAYIGNATAGSASITSNGNLNFNNSSTAGAATIISSGNLYFNDSSTAGSASITSTDIVYFNNSSTAGGAGIVNTGAILFYDSSKGGTASITNNGGAVEFNDTSSAENATITNNGTLRLYGNSTAGSAAITNGVSGNTDFSRSTGPNNDNKLSAGSIGGGGTFSLGQNELTVGGNNLSTNVTGVIADGGSGGGTGGSLVKTGTGTLTLSGANTYTGGTTVSAGTLQVGNGGTTGSVLGNITNNAALIFNRSDAVTFDGAISGSGTLQKLGAGTLTLSGANTYGGGTTISAGALQIGDGGITGSVVGNITNNAALIFNRLDAVTFGGVISGSGTLQKLGPFGTLTLAGINTYTGATTVSGGTLRISGSIASSTVTNNGTLAYIGNATAGSASITNNNNLQFNDASSAGNASIANSNGMSFGGTSTAGSATIANSNGMIFRDTSTAGNATISNSHTLQFIDSSTAGSATITITSTGSLGFSSTSTAGSAGIANSGRMIFSDTATAGSAGITNNGEMTFFDTATAGSAGITNNGSMNFFNTATAGSAMIANAGTMNFLIDSTAGSATIANNNLLQFFQRSTAGSAAIINGASGNTDFSQSDGPLRNGKLSAGSIDGGGVFKLGRNELTVGGNNLSTNVTGVIANGGARGGTGASLIKTGTGTMILSGANTYTGATTVNGGTLAVTGSILASNRVTANAGGTLAGTGTVHNALISGGTLMAGNGTAGSSMTVNGTLDFNAAATYRVNVDPATASFANVSGAATLGGATVNASFAPGSYISKKYTILTAGSINGTFGTLANTNLPANFHDSLSYDATHAYLNLDLNFSTPAANTLTGNQNNVANALINYFDTTGGIPMTFAALNANGLSQASGEAATGSQQTTFGAMNQFMGVMTDPFTTGRGDGLSAGEGGATGFADEGFGVSAYASPDRPRSKRERDAYAAIYRKAAPPLVDTFNQRWSVWAAGYGGSQTTDGNATQGANTTTSRIVGTAVGADYRFSPNTLAGFALAGGGTSFAVANAGSGRSDLFQAGAFIRHNAGPAYITAALAYGWQDVTTDRTVTIAGVDRLRAGFNANAWSGRLEGGYRFVSQGFGLTPYAAGQFTTFDLPAYAETVVSGANTFALSYGAKSVTASRSELGLRTDKSFGVRDGILTLRGRAAWAHDFNADRSVLSTFQTLPGASFVVNGARQAADAALVTGSAEMKWLNGLSVAATFEGEFSEVTRSYAGKGVVRYAW